MIERIGTDIVEVARIERSMRRPGFLTRILTAEETTPNPTPAWVAGRWAAKEAVAKCLDARPGWHDVMILAGPSGAPFVKVNERFVEPGHRLHVSISHEKAFAVAIAILERSRDC
jgi:holo-[acyl-carrier protein] synthase